MRKGHSYITWDTDAVRLLWDDPKLSIVQIGAQLNINPGYIGRYARSHNWPDRPNDFRVAQWDTARAAALFASGMRTVDIAREVGITPAAMHHYARRYWPPRPGIDTYEMSTRNRPNKSGRRLAHRAPEPPPLPSPPVTVRGRGTTLPPLPSLQEPVYVIQNC